jgi:hypothetical protein
MEAVLHDHNLFGLFRMCVVLLKLLLKHLARRPTVNIVVSRCFSRKSSNVLPVLRPRHLLPVRKGAGTMIGNGHDRRD